MTEKKAEDENVVKIPMSRTTIILAIALPISILIVVYAILFVECSYVMRNGNTAFNADPEKLALNDERTSKPKEIPEVVTVDIDKELGLTGMDESDVINKIMIDEDSSSVDYSKETSTLNTDNKDFGQSRSENTDSPIKIFISVIHIIWPTEEPKSENESDGNVENSPFQLLKNLFYYPVYNVPKQKIVTKPGSQEDIHDSAERSYHDDIIYGLSDGRYKYENYNVSQESSEESSESLSRSGNSSDDTSRKVQTVTEDVSSRSDLLERDEEKKDKSKIVAKPAENLKAKDIQGSSDTDVHEPLKGSSNGGKLDKNITRDVTSTTSDVSTSGLDEISVNDSSSKGIDKPKNESVLNKTPIAEILSKDDFPRSMYYEYKSFSIPNTFICPDDEDVKLLIGINSRVKDRERRNKIRETWTNVANLDGVKYLFIVGIGLTDDIDNRMKQESDLYQDVMQTDILDKKQNSEANPVMFLKWIYEHCPKAKVVVKVQDDVFLNIPQLYKYILDDEIDEDSMYGVLFENEAPVRNIKNETEYVSEKLYSPQFYPAYLGNEAYLIPGKYVKALYDEAEKFPYFPKENILITGILAEKLKINRKDASEYFLNFDDQMKSDSTKMCSILPYCVIEKMTSDNMEYLWKLLKSNGFQCFNLIQSYKDILASQGLLRPVNDRIIYPALIGEKPVY